jgi:acyl carrier protein
MNQFATDQSASTGAIAQTPITVEAIRTWLVNQIAEQLEVDSTYIDTDITFDNYSLDSAKALLISSRLEKLIGIPLSPTLLWHYRTIDSLAQRLVEETEETASLIEQTDDETLAKALAEIEQL